MKSAVRAIENGSSNEGDNEEEEKVDTEEVHLAHDILMHAVSEG